MFTRFVALLLLAIACYGQYDSASVLGTVTDASGSAVPNVTLTLENKQTGVRRTATSDDSGNYTFLSAPIGQYTVTAQGTGFKQSASPQFTVEVGARQRVDLKLELGDVQQTVTVSEGVQLLQTDSSDRGQVVNRQAIVNLPLNGRAYADLMLLSPGVRKSNITNRDASFNVNGLRSSHNNFMLDGIDNNAYGTSNQGFSNQVVQVNPDAVEEFKVQLNNFSAEYGRAGGAIINASTRSGTNRIHGTVWEYLRNTKLNAEGFFHPSTGVKPVLVQNQFGAAVGGPIIKDKIFLFGDYEGFRRMERNIAFATLPTMEQRQGNFGVPITNPLTGEVYANGIIPQSAITPFARKVLGDLPAPVRSTTPGTLPNNNYDRLVPVPWNDNKGDIRYDHYVSTKWTFFGRYSHRLLNRTEDSTIPGPSGGDANGNVRILNQQGVGGFNYSISPTSLIDFRLAITKTEGGKFALGSELPYMSQAYGISGLPEDPTIGGGLTSQAVNGFTSMGRQSSNPQFQNPFVINPKTNYSKLLGRHTLKAGYEYQSINTDIFDFNPQYGQNNYSGQFSRPAAGNNPLYNMADFLLGAQSSYSLNNQIVLNYRQRMHFFYLQDDFKISPKLTLNMGVRYEYATPQWEDQNRLSNYDPTTNTLIQAKDGGIYDRALVHPDRNNWAPRFGLAYQLRPRTVIRSGYGISYVHFNRLGGENLLGYNGPNIVNLTVNQTPNLPLCTGNNYVGCFRLMEQGYPTGLTDPSNFSTSRTRTNYTPADYRTSYVQSWHFTIQHELAKDLLLDVAYVGNRGTGLMILGDYNQARPLNPGETAAVDLRRPVSGFAEMQQSFGGGFSTYHGLQAKIEKKYAAGLYLINSFTWSKTMDLSSGHLEAFNNDNSRVNYRNIPSERAQGAYNQPINNTTTFVWEVPYGKGRKWGSDTNWFVDAVLGGWRLTGINLITSGQPINISYSVPAGASVSGEPTYRPIYVGGDIYSTEKSPTNYFNKAAFMLPSTTQPFGNIGRNVGRSPSIYNFDGGAHKSFALPWEGTRVEFRAEFFNLLNKTNLGAANANVSNGNFGTITSLASPARQIQFALRLAF